MKKVLVIVGSPRKQGNCDLLCDAFINGAKENYYEVNKIYVQDLNLEPCLACYACRKTKECFRKDTMSEVLQQMIDADIIVLATPVYFYSMSAQLKTFIDRTLPRYTEITNKDFYLIATAAAGKYSMERTFDSMRGFIDCLDDVEVKGTLYGAGVYQKGEVNSTTLLKQAYELGKNA